MIIVKVIFGISIGAESGIVKWTKEAFATSGRSKKMNDPIERADVYKALTTAIDEHTDIFDAIKDIPSADRPQGEWKPKNHHTDYCSECGFEETQWHTSEYYFCPFCGARMRGVDDEHFI